MLLRRRSLARPLVGLAVVIAACAAAVTATGGTSTVWTGSGTGTTTVVNDGATGGPAEFTYNGTGINGVSGNWDFHTTAASTGAVALSYTYTGFHAFFSVRVSLSAYVTSGGVTTTTPLVNAGPANCCTPPSGGFTYAGAVTLNVTAGDTYGFKMTGSNFDAFPALNGTLTIDDVTPGVTHAGYCAVAGDTHPFTGAAIPPGTFLDLDYGQPASDPHYKGAVPANFVQGQGITCSPPPAGYVQKGFAGDAQQVPSFLYPYYVPGS
jgi:hypothetical protein